MELGNRQNKATEGCQVREWIFLAGAYPSLDCPDGRPERKCFVVRLAVSRPVRMPAVMTLLFWLKKTVSFWLMPLPFCIALLTAGWWLARFPRRVKLARTFGGLGLAFLLLFGNRTVSTWLVRPVEFYYPAIPEFEVSTPPPALAACRYVVVLGSGHSDTPGWSANNQLCAAAVARIMEALRLLRGVPNAKLVVSGPGYRAHPTHAAVLAKVATTFGVDAARIVQIDQGYDTEDEAALIHAAVGNAPVAIVTSAAHMRRAAALCRKNGLTVLPCPTDYTLHPNPEWRGLELGWDLESLGRSTWAVRETIGYAWVWLRGKV